MDNPADGAPDRTRLYLISPPTIDEPSAFARMLETALGGGDVACFQLRLKTADGPASDEVVLDVAAAIAPILRARGVAFLVNDRPDLAKAAGADGVHVGQTDVDCAAARAALGPDATVGVTCHASRHLAIEAAEAGADYVAFGAFFPTETKDAPVRARPDLLEWWRFATTVPSVAIGGIAPGNCGDLARAGADFVAASSAVWGASGGPANAVAAFNAALDAALGAAARDAVATER
ncbi:MAG: thiamine phosphate synthase [Parvularculaceae bacterium]